MLAGSQQALVAFAVATTLAVVAASTVPALLGRVDRASRVVIATLAWNVLLIVPIYVLGLTNRLYAGWLAGSVSGLSLAALAIATVRLGPSAAAVEVGRTLATFVRLPLDAFVVCVRERSFAAIGVLIAVILFVWTTAQAVLAPTWGDWDCLWYHEPIIGYTIQNHGFRVVAAEQYLQKVNGYPRLTEMSMLWFGIFHGRWAVDLLNPVVLPMLAAGTYTLTYDLGRDRASAIGWAAASVTLPGVIRIVPTTMVDVHMFALLVVAFAFACRRRFAIQDAWIAIFAVTLALGSKAIVLVPGGLVCLVLFGRLLANRRAIGGRAVVIAILGGSAVVSSILAATYLRNYVLFHNPIWPDIAVDIPSLDIHWPGNYAAFDDPRVPGADRIPHALEDQLKRLYGHPFAASPGHAWQIADYGMGVPWALIPMGILALVLLVCESFVGLYRSFRPPAPDDASELRRVAWRLAFIMGPSLYLIPAFHVGRYHLMSVALGFGLVAWVGARFGARRFVDAVVALMILGNTATLVWNDRGWLRAPALLVAMANTPVPLRYHKTEFFPADTVTTALPREREMDPGDVVVFERIAYLALLWNDHYTNRVVWLEDFPDPFVRARREHAEWIYTTRGGWFDTHAARPGSGWIFVGALETEAFGNVYRRAPASRPAAMPPAAPATDAPAPSAPPAR